MAKPRKPEICIFYRNRFWRWDAKRTTFFYEGKITTTGFVRDPNGKWIEGDDPEDVQEFHPVLIMKLLTKALAGATSSAEALIETGVDTIEDLTKEEAENVTP